MIALQDYSDLFEVFVNADYVQSVCACFFYSSSNSCLHVRRSLNDCKGLGLANLLTGKPELNLDGS